MQSSGYTNITCESLASMKQESERRGRDKNDMIMNSTKYFMSINDEESHMAVKRNEIHSPDCIGTRWKKTHDDADGDEKKPMRQICTSDANECQDSALMIEPHGKENIFCLCRMTEMALTNRFAASKTGWRQSSKIIR